MNNNNYNNNLKEIYQIKPKIIEHFKPGGLLKGVSSMVKSGGGGMVKGAGGMIKGAGGGMVKGAGGMVKGGLKGAAGMVKGGLKNVGGMVKNNPGKALLAGVALGGAAYVASDAIRDTISLNNSQFTISEITLNDSTTSTYQINFLNSNSQDISINDTIQLLDTNNNIIGGPYTVIQNNTSNINNIIVTILDSNFNLTNDNKYFTVKTTLLRQTVDSTTDLVTSGGKVAGQLTGAAASGIGSGLSNTLGFSISDNIKIIGAVLSIFFIIAIILYFVYKYTKI
jgi:hypothetical protein